MFHDGPMSLGGIDTEPQSRSLGFMNEESSSIGYLVPVRTVALRLHTAE